MKIRLAFALAAFAFFAAFSPAQSASAAPPRPQGPCDIYTTAGTPCVAAHSTSRALYAAYNGPLYQVLRQSDGKTLDIGVVQPSDTPVPDAGGYADASAQDKFCANTVCWISRVYDQSPKHNDLTQAPRGGFSGPALGGFNNLPIADMAPVTVMGHKVYGVFIAPGMGIRQDDPKGTAVDDQAEGQYWVINGHHFNSGCCFDYGNAEIDSRDDDNGTMETTYFGDAPWWFHGTQPGPWVMTDQENNLVGCVNDDGTNHCPTLPNITWRFVTAMAKGEPRHWTSMGGDAQKGPLSVMFSGRRVNDTYDPMRKQGAILLGNGGDNSNGSQGTFYEGAMTAAGTFPSDATDQLIQANVVAASYNVASLAIAPASAVAAPMGLQTFTPGATQSTTVTFTNTTGAPASNVQLSLALPAKQWTAVADGSPASIAGPVAPGASVSTTFKITSGPARFNGDLIASASWTNATTGQKQTETAVEKIRNVSPIKINEFRIASGSANATDSFIELYNAGKTSIDLSNWTLTVHPARQAIFSSIQIPAGTKLAAGRFYVLGLSDSGLAVPALAGDTVVHLRSTTGMKAGDTLTLGDGATPETRTIASLGAAASNHTTLWQPLPDGPVITIPAGSTNVPVDCTDGFVVGQKIALGYGATYPSVARDVEKYEVATVTAVGKPGTQAYLADEAIAGATNIKVTSLENITAGDKIRLDIDSLGHGIETVTVAHVGTVAVQTNLTAALLPGAAQIKVRRAHGIAVGDKLIIGTPATREFVSVTAITHNTIDIKPALAKNHIADEWVVMPGTGLDLAAPLEFNHAANLPFSARGTGISFTPATAFAHSSNEPVQALGSGITLNKPLAKAQPINAPVRDASVITAGFQGTPSQWFGGPELTTNAPLFGRTISVKEGSLILRDAGGLVADSLNYGGLVDPWAAEGWQGESGFEKGGCFAPAPGTTIGFGLAAAGMPNVSVGRSPDGADTDSNCSDFHLQAAATLAADSAAGVSNIKVSSVNDFVAGQTVGIDAGDSLDSAVIATVGTAGATTASAATASGVTLIPVASIAGFSEGQTITIDSGENQETAVVTSIHFFGELAISVSKPLAHAHAKGAQLSGSGITLTAPLAHAHAKGARLSDNLPTPGAPNHYAAAAH